MHSPLLGSPEEQRRNEQTQTVEGKGKRKYIVD